MKVVKIGIVISLRTFLEFGYFALNHKIVPSELVDAIMTTTLY